MTDRDVWKLMLVSLSEYVARLRSEGPLPHNPPRSSPRVSCSLPLDLISPLDPDEAWCPVSGTAVDFSAAGLRVRVAGAFQARVTYQARITGHPEETDLAVQIRSIWARPGPNGAHEGGFEFVGFDDDRSPDEVARFFDHHPGLGRVMSTIPVRRDLELSPPVMLAVSSGGVRKGFLLKLTRTGMAMACRSEFQTGTEVQMMMQVPTGHLRAHGKVAATHPMAQPGFSRIEVQFHERLASDHLHALLPVLWGGGTIDSAIPLQ